MSTDILGAALEHTVRRAVEQAVAPLAQQLAALQEQLAGRPAAPGPGEDAFLTTTQAAELLAVLPETIRVWLAEGKLTPHGTARALRVSRRELLALRPDAPGAEVVDLETRVESMLARRRGR